MISRAPFCVEMWTNWTGLASKPVHSLPSLPIMVQSRQEVIGGKGQEGQNAERFERCPFIDKIDRQSFVMRVRIMLALAISLAGRVHLAVSKAFGGLLPLFTPDFVSWFIGAESIAPLPVIKICSALIHCKGVSSSF